MCGRFTLNIDADFSSHYQLSALPQLAPKYQAYPGAIAPVIVNHNSQNTAQLKSWGMGVYKSFNARAETILQKPTFSQSFLPSRINIYFLWPVSTRIMNSQLSL
jgi:putative SOS response-associated peptidase YedK